ncbi:H/ACA ribonucleoprotein complex subunit 1-like [Macrobrachium nipponense]|uniref:H/ACA ribonucleoprotein complex subunit 1-like n=1 Tax=Macrobrachium nipponense TaxID=159736 RepID=UPI0030C7C3E9
MKTIALVLVLVAAASAQLGGGNFGGGAGGNVAGGAGGAGGLTGGLGGLFGPPRNYGPKVYGPGANNRFALPPNPILMERALAIVNQVPGALIFLDTNGEIKFTDRFGREADIVHPSGIDLSELIEN